MLLKMADIVWNPPTIIMRCSPIRAKPRRLDKANHQHINHLLIIRNTAFAMPEDVGEASIQTIYAALANTAQRNEMVLMDIREAVRHKRSPLVLTERKEHLERLTAFLRQHIPHDIVVHSGLFRRMRRM